MSTDRRTIFHLIALGRITPSEAERLLMASNSGSESFWLFAACALFAVLAQVNFHQGLPALMHIAHAVARWEPLHRALSVGTHL